MQGVGAVGAWIALKARACLSHARADSYLHVSTNLEDIEPSTESVSPFTPPLAGQWIRGSVLLCLELRKWMASNRHVSSPHSLERYRTCSPVVDSRDVDR